MKKVVASLVVAVALLGCSNWNKYTPKALDKTATEEEIRKNMAGDSITGLTIKVDDNGVVTLTGHLPRDKREKAVEDARKVNGVTRVVDNISLD